MHNLRILKDLSILSNKDFTSSLELIFPSNRINLKILLEIERRNLRNDQKILKYLIELQKLQIQLWSVERLLLSFYDLDHPSIKVVTPPYVTEEIKKIKNFKVRKVIKSLKCKKMTPHFMNFIEILENLVFNLHLGDENTKELVLTEMTEFIYKFLDIIDNIKVKDKDFLYPINGKYHFKETWLVALKYKKITDQILFLILVNLKIDKNYKCQLLFNSLNERLSSSECRDLYNIICKNNILKPTTLFNTDCIKEKLVKPTLFSFNVKQANKTTNYKSLEWYENRTKK